MLEDAPTRRGDLWALETVSYFKESNKMSHFNNIQVSATLSEASWRAILDILQPVCQLRGGGWVQWQQSISQVIRAAIEQVKSPSQPHPSVSECRRIAEYDLFDDPLDRTENVIDPTEWGYESWGDYLDSLPD